jgi:putative DNA-invertase from lambdoid prophage Rac
LLDLLRAGVTLVVRWIDRLGRNYTDVIDVVREFMRHCVIVRTVINKTDIRRRHQRPNADGGPRRLLTSMAASAQAQAEATRAEFAHDHPLNN